MISQVQASDFWRTWASSSVKDFSRTTAPRILKFGTRIGYDLLYCARKKQLPHACHSLYLSIFCGTFLSMGDLGVQVSVHPSFHQHLTWVSCERSFVLIILKLCISFLHGMKMCLWFGYNCKIIFCHFFHIVNLVIFSPQYIYSGSLL